MGYTLAYGGIGADDDDPSHHFGLDFGAGVQLGKHFTLGYNLNFFAPGKVKSHWARIGFLF